MKKASTMSHDESLCKEHDESACEEHEEPELVEVTSELDDIYYCDWRDCGIEFREYKKLIRHINSQHINMARPPFVCEWEGCTRQTSCRARHLLMVHVRLHTGDKLHKCEYEDCFEVFCRIENLKKHMLAHAGEFQYICEYDDCSIAFSNESTRTEHYHLAHRERPYTCKEPGCQRRYRTPCSLRNHVRIIHKRICTCEFCTSIGQQDFDFDFDFAEALSNIIEGTPKISIKDKIMGKFGCVIL